MEIFAFVTVIQTGILILCNITYSPDPIMLGLHKEPLYAYVSFTFPIKEMFVSIGFFVFSVHRVWK